MTIYLDVPAMESSMDPTIKLNASFDVVDLTEES